MDGYSFVSYDDAMTHSLREHYMTLNFDFSAQNVVSFWSSFTFLGLEARNGRTKGRADWMQYEM